MESLKRKSALEVDPLQRRQRVLLRRLRAVHALQRRAIDDEGRQLAAARREAQLLSERRSELKDQYDAAGRAAPAVRSAVGAEAADVAARLTVAERAVSRLAAAARDRGARMRRLVDAQAAEQGALHHRLSEELSRAGAAPMASVAIGDDGTAAAVPPPYAAIAAAAAYAGLAVCGGCATHVPKAEVVTCGECARELCGRGGRSAAAPLAWPCVSLTRCKCGASFACYDCISGGAARVPLFWRRCEGRTCGAWMCAKEGADAALGCPDCGVEPLCKGCRTDHGCGDDDDDGDDSESSS